MPRFSDYFSIGLSQHQLDFVDVSNEYDTPVYVDPYAIEIRDDIWAAQASDYIRTFFLEVLNALRSGDTIKAKNLMSHMQEPRETYLGISKGTPNGKGIGSTQSSQLILSMKGSVAYKTGLLSDLSEMALYVDGIDRDKISDLTTNIIRRLLVEYTNEQCKLHGISTQTYSSPPLWDNLKRDWISDYVQIPFIDKDPVLLVPKYIVRRSLSLENQEFYNKQITDFLVAENLKANTSLVKSIKGGKEKKVLKKDVRSANPKSKSYIAEFVQDHPEVLELYKEIAKKKSVLTKFSDHDEPSLSEICFLLIEEIKNIKPGKAEAEQYHKIVMGSLTALFYPNLILPKKEWQINEGRKRIDIVYTNAGDNGFFAQRRDDKNTVANTVIIECKNYDTDIANPELDQLLGRFDGNRGKFGILTCRSIDNASLLEKRCRDMSTRSQGYIITLTDDDLIEMLTAKAQLNDKKIESILHEKYRKLLE